MKAKNKLLELSLAAMAMSVDTQYRPKANHEWRKSNMTKAQSKRRAKSKRQKQARKKNRK